jgi:hypothetical protein
MASTRVLSRRGQYASDGHVVMIFLACAYIRGKTKSSAPRPDFAHMMLGSLHEQNQYSILPMKHKINNNGNIVKKPRYNETQSTIIMAIVLARKTHLKKPR